MPRRVLFVQRVLDVPAGQEQPVGRLVAAREHDPAALAGILDGSLGLDPNVLLRGQRDTRVFHSPGHALPARAACPPASGLPPGEGRIIDTSSPSFSVVSSPLSASMASLLT